MCKHVVEIFNIGDWYVTARFRGIGDAWLHAQRLQKDGVRCRVTIRQGKRTRVTTLEPASAA